MSDKEPVRYSLDGGVATVTIDRPERKNALSVEAMNGLTDIWERIEADPTVRVVILTSTDCGVFSAGLDLKQASEIRARDGIDILTLMRDPMQTTMRSVTKPIIAAMTGSLMAGGMLLALQCDLRVGLAGTRAGITEVRMGRGTPWAVPLLWMLPQPLLMELVITGETMPIERLAAYGFTNYLEATPDAVRGACADACGDDRRGRAALGQSREGEHPRRNGSGLCAGARSRRTDFTSRPMRASTPSRVRAPSRKSASRFGRASSEKDEDKAIRIS